MNITSLLHKSVAGNSLTEEEAYFFMTSIMKGEVSDIILSSFLTSIRMRNETGDELVGFVRAMRESCVKINSHFDFEYLDTCGTGGDEKKSINISTLSAITLGSLGIKIAKHGNRSVSSLCGSSDLLSALEYNVSVPHEDAAKRLTEKGFTFLFAPDWHPSMKFAGETRKQLGFRTVFNILGPMSNPFAPPFQILGVYNSELLPKVMHVLTRLGAKAAIVCNSVDGFDEFSIFADTKYLLYKDGEVSEHLFSPDSLSINNIKDEEIFCSSKEDAINLSKRILSGQIITGSYAVALNSGAALFLMGKAGTIKEGFQMALAQLKSGKVMDYFLNLKN
ncbi:MAG: anthranilate phosphoribosyltransferase [Leptospiraceae bacterium]|nr:anthranilate phosphoribosyltransferase [Leptospiraceae bacterium]